MGTIQKDQRTNTTANITSIDLNKRTVKQTIKMPVKTLKFFYNGEIRRAALPSSQSTPSGSEAFGFSGLRRLIRRLFGSEAARCSSEVTYEDEDDRVIIKTDNDLRLAIDEQQGSVLKLYISSSKDTSVSESESEEFEVVNEPESKKENKAKEVEDKPNQNQNQAKLPKDVKKQERQKRKELREQKKELRKQQRKQQREQLKEQKKEQRKQQRKELRQEKREEESKAEPKDHDEQKQKQNQCPWRNWRKHREEQREQREKARTEFLEEANAFLGDEKVISSLQAALPLVADMLVKGDYDFNQILNTVTQAPPVLREHPFAKRMLPLVQGLVSFLPAESGMFGPVLLDVILDLQTLFKDDDPDAEKDKQKRKSVPLRRFVQRVFRSAKQSFCRHSPQIHFGVVCDQCPEGSNGPTVGNRWKKKGENYDLCNPCYNKTDEKSKQNYRKIDRTIGCGHKSFGGLGGPFGMPAHIFNPAAASFFSFGGIRMPGQAFGAFGCRPHRNHHAWRRNHSSGKKNEGGCKKKNRSKEQSSDSSSSEKSD